MQPLRNQVMQSWRSDDKGATWHSLGTSPLPLCYNGLMVAFSDGAVLLMNDLAGPDSCRLWRNADRDRLWRSADQGDSWQSLSPPPWPPRTGASVVVLPDGAVLLLGGWDIHHGCLADVWRSDDRGTSWWQLPKPPWPARESASASAFEEGVVLIFGGLNPQRIPLGDAWCSGDSGASWRSIPEADGRYCCMPPPRSHASMVALSDGIFFQASLLLAGRASESSDLNEIWVVALLPRSTWAKEGLAAAVRWRRLQPPD